MSRFFVFLLLLFFNSSLIAQISTIISVGAIEGEVRLYYGSLEWINTSPDSVEVSFWSGDEKLKVALVQLKAAPQEKKQIPFTINTEAFVGAFKSELRLVTVSGVVVHEYEIVGRVLSPEKDVFKAYRNEFWPFRSKSQVVNLKSGFIGTVLSATTNLYNFGGSNIDLDSAYVSDYYGVEFFPTQVPHDSFTRMNIVLKSDSILPPGFIREVIKVKNKNDSVIFSVPVQFTLENTPQLDVSNAPNIVLSVSEFDFKVMEEGSKQTTMITLTNTGGQVLDLRKIESNCSCLTYYTNKTKLEPEESIALSITFDASGRTGFDRKTLAIFSNDPDQPTAVLVFKATVR